MNNILLIYLIGTLVAAVMMFTFIIVSKKEITLGDLIGNLVLSTLSWLTVLFLSYCISKEDYLDKIIIYRGRDE